MIVWGRRRDRGEGGMSKGEAEDVCKIENRGGNAEL